MRDIEGKYLSEDVILALKSFLLERGCKVVEYYNKAGYTRSNDPKALLIASDSSLESTIDGMPNIISVHLNKGFYSLEFTEPGKSDIGYVEVPEDWVKSFIRDKKINQIID